ncbi:MAG: hypothetical protein ACW99A_23475, partial [Candidatus Kariarchaeaceae archaeon]
MVINTAPEISGLVTITPGSPITTETLDANWVYSDLDDDSEGASIITWYKNGVPSYYNISSISSANTKKGENWYFIIRVYDGEEYSIQYISATIQIGNTAPVASNIIFNPSAPLRGDDLQISYTWMDADQNVNDIETGTIIRWYRNGTLIPSMNDTTLIPGGLITKNYEWNVTIVPSDGTDQGLMIFAVVLIGNTLPEVSSISIIPGTTTYTTSDLISSFVSSDVDGDSVSVFTIMWYNNSQLVASLTDNFTVPSALTQKHDIWYYTIQVFDGTDLSIVYQSPNTTILNSKPTVTIFTLNPSSPSTLDTLTASWTYADSDNDTELSPRIRWFNNSILQSPFNDDLLISPSATLKNQIWFYTIEVYDGEEYSEVFVSTVIQIQNSLPNVANFNFTNSAIPTTIDDLDIDYDFNDADNDFESTSTRIFWYKNSTLQALYNGKKSIPASQTSHFDIWTVTVQPHDGESFGTVISINITIINTKPVIGIITYFPIQSAYTTSDLSLTYTTLDVDNDVIVAFRTRWYIGPNSFSLTYNPSYDDLIEIPSNQTLKGEWWAVNISIFDGRDWSDWSVLQIKEIRNSLPIAENIVLSPNGTIYTNNVLTLTWNYIDADNDTETTAYIRWYRNGLEYFSLENSSVASTVDTSKNDNWYVVLQVFDGFNLSVSYILNTITIQNSIPVIISAEINDNDSTTDVSNDLMLNFVFSDADPLDFDRNRTIYWFKYNFTTTDWDHQPAFNHLFSVP